MLKKYSKKTNKIIEEEDEEADEQIILPAKGHTYLDEY